MTKKLFICALIALWGLNGCSTASHTETQDINNDTVLESYNKAMFGVNRQIDKFVIRPVVKGYRAVTNKFVRDRVSNFFNNIDEPISAANHILQGEFADSGRNLGRFAVNSTIGAAGLFDVASKWGMQKNKTGFDETMATWCIPDGPFVVLPIIGPSTPRAAVGFAADSYSSPMYWLAEGSDSEDVWLAYYSANGLKYINLMAENIDFLEDLEAGSVDYYETIKSAYLQNRGKLKICGKNDGETTPEYDFDMDMDEE